MILGIDMGGTHIDGVIIDQGEITHTVKNPRDHDDLFNTIWTAIKDLLKNVDKKAVSRIHLSTTVSTNAIVERKTAKVGMLLQSGPGMAYGFEEYWDQIEFLEGYCDHRGKMVKELDKEEAMTAMNRFVENDVEALAVVTKFSTRNPSHEVAIKEIMEKVYSVVTMGHTMSGKLNFPRRVHTSYLNAAISKNFEDFALNIEKSLIQEGINVPIYVLKADGGTMDLETAKRKPVETILSGPAASYMGMSALVDHERDGILLDIGGTTTDIFFVVGGVPVFEPLGITIGEHKTLVRSIYSKSVGIGGDSQVEMIDGNFVVGPKRVGLPVAFGGQLPTPTDAMIVLDEIYDGDKFRARDSLRKFADKLRVSVEEVATLILDAMVDQIHKEVIKGLSDVNSKPVYTIKELLQDREIVPEFVTVIGGPARILSSRIKRVFNLGVVLPGEFQLANAIGAALANPTLEINMIADTERGRLSVPELELYEPVDDNFDLNQAEIRSLELVIEAAEKLGASNVEAEVVESSSFNMLKGYYGNASNIRVRAQIKPGLNQTLKGHGYTYES